MAVTDIVDPRLEAVEMEINYQFSDRSILSEALRAAGSVPITASRSQDNKGLALVGDAAIRMMLILHGHKAHASRGTKSIVRTNREPGSCLLAGSKR